MPDISAIAAAVSAFKAAKDIGESMVGLRDAAAFQGKLLEFQSKLLDANNAVFAAQEERFSLLQRIGQLEKEMADFKAWHTRKERYELKNVGYSSFAYVLKKEERGSEPPHWACANCFENEHISIIQYTSKRDEGFSWTCPRCKSTIEPGKGVVVWCD
ncbi:hypothetical protein [Bradyrhizobium sp. LTSPM299]|uniref:hypothetical protein n=1 Tax=Bradyrhizobium sp. LTSPM299 TaxID=1619233 RepID=UPI0006791D43|nr:hypothetical protein [Bradyrhizobium sp. LTSPM299]